MPTAMIMDFALYVLSVSPQEKVAPIRGIELAMAAFERTKLPGTMTALERLLNEQLLLPAIATDFFTSPALQYCAWKRLHRRSRTPPPEPGSFRAGPGSSTVHSPPDLLSRRAFRWGASDSPYSGYPSHSRRRGRTPPRPPPEPRDSARPVRGSLPASGESWPLPKASPQPFRHAPLPRTHPRECPSFRLAPAPRRQSPRSTPLRRWLSPDGGGRNIPNAPRCV